MNQAELDNTEHDIRMSPPSQNPSNPVKLGLESIPGYRSWRKFPVVMEVGEPIPKQDEFGVSVSLPTWDDTLGWARRDGEIIRRLRTGYPRFFIHPLIRRLSEEIVKRWMPAEEDVKILLFPRQDIAQRCVEYIRGFENDDPKLRILSLINPDNTHWDRPWRSLHAVICNRESIKYGKKFWQHTGEGITSRRAAFTDFDRELYQLVDESSLGGRHGQIDDGLETPVDDRVCTLFGLSGTSVIRHSDLRYAWQRAKEKRLIRERVAGLVGNEEIKIPTSDVFLYPSGMNAISEVYRALLLALSPRKKTVAFGFLYVDTFKVLSTTGSKDAALYGHGSDAELDELERALEIGEEILALFCEFPGNPLLKSPDIKRIRKLADQYGFAVVCDDTIGTSVNCDLLPWVDVVVTSLTKLFSGECNVMGGTATINPVSKHHDSIHRALKSLFVDTYYPVDAYMMEQNSREFVTRVHKTNTNAKALAELLQSQPSVEQVYYPSLVTKDLYDVCKRPGGGYGYLLTIRFKKDADAVVFHDALNVAKGPSLGTTFTLACAYTLFAHYGELEWAAEYGVTEHLVRISVGEEPIEELREVVMTALGSIPSGQIGELWKAVTAVGSILPW